MIINNARMRIPALLAFLAAILVAVTNTSVTAQAADTESKAPADFVALHDVAPAILQDMRYSTPHNFIGTPINGYVEPLCIVTAPTAKALAKAEHYFLAQGYTLKVYDCYRPQRAVDQFVDWAQDLTDLKMKDEFYPQVDKANLFSDGYIAAKSGHSRGSTIDLTLVKLPAHSTRPYVPGEKLEPCYAPQAQRFPDNSIDMGTGFDCFDTLAHTLDPRIVGVQHSNRLLLKNELESVGFVNLAEEWWHFTLAAEPYPDTYFNFPVSRSSLTS